MSDRRNHDGDCDGEAVILTKFPPMGVYETLFKFTDATAKYMGDPGTHPWAQGYPITTQIPGGPPLPEKVELTHLDLKYPKATGEIELRSAISDYYNHFYDAGITPENVAVFAGGRPGILATLAFLLPDTSILIDETEYTPYYDMLEILRHPVRYLPSNQANRFRPVLSDYDEVLAGIDGRKFLVKSNPCNPTGVAATGSELETLVKKFTGEDVGALFDEAYEFYAEEEPESAIRYVEDINASNIFIIGAATKGLQVPGLRIGWAIAAEQHIEIFRNYSSWGMGGVSRASQLYVTRLLEIDRVTQARRAVANFFWVSEKPLWRRSRPSGA